MKSTTILMTAHELAGPEGMVGADVRIRQVSSTRVKGKAVKKFRDLLDGQLFGLGWRHQVIGFGLQRL